LKILLDLLSQYQFRVAGSKAFWWSRIPNDTRGQSRIFLSDSGCSIGSLLQHIPQLRIPAESVQFLMKLLLKQRILAVYHDFHWVLVATRDAGTSVGQAGRKKLRVMQA